MRHELMIRTGCVIAIVALTAIGCGRNEPAATNSQPPVQQPRPTQAEPTPAAPDAAPPPMSEPAGPRPTSVHATDAPPAEDMPQDEVEVPADTTPGDKTATFDGFTAPKPATWIYTPTQRVSAIAEYGIPGRDGFDQGRLTVFRVGGSPEDNIRRWQGQQFRNADQTAVEPKIETMEVNGWDVTLAEFTGEYKAPGSVNFSKDYTLIAAIIPDAPGGQIVLYMVGPTGTIEPNRRAFMDMLHGIRQVEPAK